MILKENLNPRLGSSSEQTPSRSRRRTEVLKDHCDLVSDDDHHHDDDDIDDDDNDDADHDDHDGHDDDNDDDNKKLCT